MDVTYIDAWQAWISGEGVSDLKMWILEGDLSPAGVNYPNVAV